MRISNIGRLALLIGVSFIVTGCTRSEHSMVPVSGTVTFDGRPCPASGMLTFQPKSVAEDVPRRPGRAKFERDGAFRVTTFDDGDGLLPGTYLINVRCESGQPDPSRPDPFADIQLIDPNYKPEEVVVEDGSPEIELNVDVPLRKK